MSGARRAWILPTTIALGLAIGGGVILLVGLGDDGEDAGSVETPVATAPRGTDDTSATTDTPGTAPIRSATTSTPPETTLPVTTVPVTTLPVTTLPETTVPVTTLPVTTLPETTTTVTLPPRPAGLLNIGTLPRAEYVSEADDPENPTTFRAFDGDPATSWRTTQTPAGGADLYWSGYDDRGYLIDVVIHDIHVVGNQYSADETLRAGYGFSNVHVTIKDAESNVTFDQQIALNPAATDAVIPVGVRGSRVFFTFSDPISPDGQGAIGEIEITVLP